MAPIAPGRHLQLDDLDAVERDLPDSQGLSENGDRDREERGVAADPRERQGPPVTEPPGG